MEKERFSVISCFVFLVILLLSGCGGGGGGDDDTPAAPNTTVYDVSKFTSLTPGTTFSTILTGTDTQGFTYSGSSQSSVQGIVSFEGKDLTLKRQQITIVKNNVGVVLSTTSNSYFNPDRTLYKIVFDNGVVATPINTFPLPTTVQVGDFAGQDLSYSNGNVLFSDWNVVDAGNGNANIVVTSTTNGLISDLYTIYLLANGDINTTKEILYNFPLAGVNTTLNGQVN